jgi:predicted ATPase
MDLSGEFEDAAWWVDLTPLSDPDLVGRTVASTLDVRGAPGGSIAETLAEHLEARETLLALDNCEHLIAGCAALVETLLCACPGLRVIATSREPLGVAGEVSWPVPPLSLPDPETRLAEDISRCGSVRLFVARVGAVAPDFSITEENAPEVARLCERLDGMPLAIELAASRTKMLSPRQILARLDDRFRLVSGGPRTAAPRHRTLRATMDWSHDLLEHSEKILFRRLSVFSGGWTLEAAETVCAGEGAERDDVLDLLARLVDKSLVVARESGGEARYRMLETIRQYGWEKLEASGEESEVRRRHADFHLTLAEEAEPAMVGPEQHVWVERLEREHDNIRAALGCLGEEREAERGLRLSAALLRFWWFRGHLAEGRERLEGMLDLPEASLARDEARAKALHVLGGSNPPPRRLRRR